MGTQSSIVLTSIHESVGIVTLNRPESRNAVTTQLLEDLRTALATLDAHDEVSALILTGTDPAFCAGVDLNELSAPGYGTTRNMSSALVRQDRPWPSTQKPLIGAINGAAVTGGLEFALHCDVLIASEKARFADLHAKFGMLPTWGLSALLPSVVGTATAIRMSLTGEFVDAASALRIGLVSEVTGHDDLLVVATGLARRMGGFGAQVSRATLANYREQRGSLVDSGRAIEAANARAHRETAFDQDHLRRQSETLHSAKE